ncbi:synaptotagmin-16 [Anopheles bellator]|uniref:synaptotagmin-16 n=1 Tax=Anopheles bellator TaxID=139047 RepID=UPI002648236B|nr:synaptotagmin-16 [Anopheles bellator]
MTTTPIEVTTCLGIALGIVALILVLFLYINKIRCFSTFPAFLSFDEHLISEKTFHRIRNRFAYDGHNSSDSEDETIRRLRLEPCSDSYSDTSYFQTSENTFDHISHFNGLNKILSCKNANSSRDPLAIAEGGKVGMLHSSNESSSSEFMNLESSTKQSTESTKTQMSFFALRPFSKANDNDSIDTIKGEMLLPELTKESDERAVGVHKKNNSFGNDNNAGGNDLLLEKTERKGNNFTETGTAIKSPFICEQEPLVQQDDLDVVNRFNNDCILVFSQEPLYDTSDLKSLKSDVDITTNASEGLATTASSNGSLEISLLYDAPMRKMTVHVMQARGISSRSEKNQLTHTQVRLLMLPAKRQKHKTKIRSGENPQFMESFLLHRVNPEEVNSMGLRIRVYGCERMRRERLIGETIVSFAHIDLELETNLWLQLEPRGSSIDTTSTSDLLSIARSDSAGSTASMQHGGVPELLLGLGYNGITGRLTVEIVKGSHFRNHYLPKVPDTYVKLCLVSSMGHEIARAKSSTRRGQPNPLFKETFIFQVALFQLNDVTLIVSVYAKRNMKRNEMVGWFSMGLNSSGPEEMTHWNEVRESCSRSEMITRWHVLVDS